MEESNGCKKEKQGDGGVDQGIELFIDGKQVPMVPFVQKILKNTILGLVGSLDGYREGASISIKL